MWKLAAHLWDTKDQFENLFELGSYGDEQSPLEEVKSGCLAF